MSENETKGPIQIFDNSVPSINDAMLQIMGRLDSIEGLRGRTQVYDRLGASAPTVDGDVAISPVTAASVPSSGIPELISHDLRIDGNFGFNVAPVAGQTVGALTNNVSSGGTDGTIATYSDLIIYANDATAIRNDIYQLARSLKQVVDALRVFGFGI